MGTLAPRHQRILNHLKNSRKKQSTKDIKEALEIGSYQLLSRDLRFLLSERLIKRIPSGRGHQYHYTFNSTNSGRISELVSKASSNTTIQRLFRQFANDPTVKLANLAWKLPDSYRRLFQVALDVSLGSPVGDELLEVKKDLERLQELAGNFHRICGGLLDNPVIWDSVKFAEYILEDEDPDEIKGLLDDFQQLSGD